MPDPDAPKSYAFVLIPGYSQLGFSCALEALSLANRYPGGRRFYRWRILSESGAAVAAYNGVEIGVDGPLAELARDETIVICAGEDVGKGASKKLLSWLRQEVRRGMDFGALSSGTYVLARAGLIADKRVTTHWEYRSALTEVLPDVIMEDSIFSVDGRVFTTAGGAASMDMMLDRIRQDYGTGLATWVADQMVYTDPRLPNHSQRAALHTRSQVRNGKLAMALQVMENNIEDPLTPDEIAEIVELSTRQLERLFAKYINVSPKRYYLKLRLAVAFLQELSRRLWYQPGARRWQHHASVAGRCLGLGERDHQSSVIHMGRICSCAVDRQIYRFERGDARSDIRELLLESARVKMVCLDGQHEMRTRCRDPQQFLQRLGPDVTVSEGAATDDRLICAIGKRQGPGQVGDDGATIDALGGGHL
jgi:transcriptional regulator GlxA family with amidase domain